MSLPSFFSRISDSITPLLRDEADLRSFLEGKSVRLEAPDDLELHPFHLAGFLLLVNLCARLYPRIRVRSSQRIVDECRIVALEINPSCDLTIAADESEASATLCWSCPANESLAVVIAPNGWEVLIDLPEAARVQPTNMLVALAAAAIGASELFRHVFCDFLANGRTSASPGRFNVLTHAPTSAVLPDLPSNIDVGRVHLVGAGAVGQAAVYALARVSARGTLVVVDPETITSSNLQRYVLATDRDIGRSKCSIIERAFAKTKQIATVSVESSWHFDHPELQDAAIVCAAVDSEGVRIALQAGLPLRAYNAWTQPADIGWSRHEQFGVEPCLACLYWPTRARPNYHENVARSTRQHELRVLAYLSARIPVDIPLQVDQIPKLPQYPIPPEANEWTQRSFLDDVITGLGVDPQEVPSWKGKLLPELYREGICAGALIRRQATEVPTEMAVPLAHQSVLAGIMLITQLLVGAHAELREHRNIAMENRLDLLSGFPQLSARPRQKTPGCLCSDEDFTNAYSAKWRQAPLHVSARSSG